MTPPQIYYVAVHGGAGCHGRALEGQVKAAMKRACTGALQTAFRPSPITSALSLVEVAISILEDEDCLNAGYGSNLTFEGTVECDAAIMDGRTGDFGSVGAVSGVRNPIKLANAVLGHARVPDRLGRIRPLTLVSSGAHGFAQTHGIETVDPASMIEPRAAQDWRRWMRRYDEESPRASPSPVLAAAGPEVLPRDTEHVMQDTVGAIAWDSQGNLAAGVSRFVDLACQDGRWCDHVSGGLLLKHSGRIGEVKTTATDLDSLITRYSSSGAGEQIVRAGLGRTIADALRPSSDGEGGTEADVHELLMKILSTQFYDPVRGDDHPNAGVLLMTKESQESGGGVIPRLWCAFTTKSMAVAYANSEKFTPKVKILRRPKAQLALAMTASPVYITALPLHE